MITLLTPTGHRPEAFNLCKKFINRQTYKGPMQWVIVYDSPEAPDTTGIRQNISVETYKGPKEWREGINTQRFNMDLAIQKAKGDFIFVIEDDDWYSPQYIETYIWLMSRWDVVGEGNNNYYNLERMAYREWKNVQHASLCSTAIKKSKLDLLDRAVNSGEIFYDIALWRMVRQEKHKGVINVGMGLNVGMKGLPGRYGIGGGHAKPANADMANFEKDKNASVLIDWVGAADAKVYIDLRTKYVSDGSGYYR